MAEKFEGENHQKSGEERISKDIEFAIEHKLEVLLTVSSLDGKSLNENIVTPEFFEEDVLWVTTEDGRGIALEVSRIKKAELPDESEEGK